MSHHLVNFARRERMPAIRKVVLWILADGAVQSSGRVNFEIHELAEACGQSVSSVRTQTKALAATGHIEILHRNRDKTWAYRVLVGRVAAA